MKIIIKSINHFCGNTQSVNRKVSLCFCVPVLKPIFLLLMITNFTFSQSSINFEPGTIIDVQAGASVCADSVTINGTFTGGGIVCGLLYSLNITNIIEGFYDASTDLMISDTATVYLRSSVIPYPVIDSDKQLLNSSGAGAFGFINAVNGEDYYIVVTHRNSIETWSSATPVFSGGTLTYNFTSAAAQAYGDNMKLADLSPVVFAVFSGDVNQDGTIDAGDLSQVENDAANSTSGYVPSDVTGDNFVDASDLSIVENNTAVGVIVITP